MACVKEVPVAPPAADPEKVAEEEEKISIIQSRDEEVPGLGARAGNFIIIITITKN